MVGFPNQPENQPQRLHFISKTNHNVCILFPKPTTTFAFYSQNQPQRLHFISKTNYNVCILFPKPTTTFAFPKPTTKFVFYFPNQPQRLYFISQTNHNVRKTGQSFCLGGKRQAILPTYSHSNTIAVPGDDNLSNTNN